MRFVESPEMMFAPVVLRNWRRMSARVASSHEMSTRAFSDALNGEAGAGGAGMAAAGAGAAGLASAGAGGSGTAAADAAVSAAGDFSCSAGADAVSGAAGAGASAPPCFAMNLTLGRFAASAESSTSSRSMTSSLSETVAPCSRGAALASAACAADSAAGGRPTAPTVSSAWAPREKTIAKSIANGSFFIYLFLSWDPVRGPQPFLRGCARALAHPSR